MQVKTFHVTETPQFRGFWDDVERGRWEPYTFEILDRYVPRHQSYLDVGAWIGPTVLYASRLCKYCFALEPDPVAHLRLKENIDFDGGQNIIVSNSAVLDRPGTILLGSEELGNSMTRLSAAHPGRQVVEVPATTLGIFVGQNCIPAPMFIKMDVEGAEELILRDFDFFNTHKPTLYLSLHPQWFRNPTTAMEAIGKVGSLYRYHVYPASGDTNTVLFTDLS
jgi:FkbM family methyltransferase